LQRSSRASTRRCKWRGQRTDAVAEILRARGIRFIFATGYGVAGVSAEWRDVPVVQKPFQLEELSAALARIRT
jgi:hypothetical protein